MRRPSPRVRALALGVVQGLTEFLPVSSSAHVAVAGRLLAGPDDPRGGDPGAAFSAVTQLGTEAAVLVHFRHDIARIVDRWAGSLTGRVPRDDPDARLAWYVAAGSLPIGAAGYGLRHVVRGHARDLRLTAAMLAAFGLVLGAADRRGPQTRTLADLDLRDALLLGGWQALSLVPGVSRSGGTIAGARTLGYSRTEATRYSFLLAIPAVVASGVFELADLRPGHEDDAAAAPTGGHPNTVVAQALSGPAPGPDALSAADVALATAVAGAVGHGVIAWLMRRVSTGDLAPFVAYRLAAAAGLTWAVRRGTLPPR